MLGLYRCAGSRHKRKAQTWTTAGQFQAYFQPVIKFNLRQHMDDWKLAERAGLRRIITAIQGGA